MGEDLERLRETLAALDMPPEGLRRWFEHNEAFCRRHGEKHYREWLELYERCRAAMEEWP